MTSCCCQSNECSKPEVDAECSAIDQIFAVDTIQTTPIAERENEIRGLASCLFRNFADVETKEDALFVSQECFGDQWLDKAEKLYEMSGSYKAAKRFIHMLNFIDVTAGKQIVDRL